MLRVFLQGCGSEKSMKLMTIVYLLMVACAGATNAATQTPQPNVAEQYLFAAANQDRVNNCLPTLVWNENLAVAARLHAYQMAKREQISHQFAGEQDLATRAGHAGAHFSLITENVAEAPDASRIDELWMASAGHRANLLDVKVDSVGIAVIRAHGEFYAVEDFARTLAKLSIQQQEAQVGRLIASGQLAVLPTTPAARQTCAMQRGFAGSRQPWFLMRYTTSNLSRLPPELISQLKSGKYRQALVGACDQAAKGPFTAYSLAVMLYP